MWIQRLLQSAVVAWFDVDSAFRICWEDAELMINRRKKWAVVEKKIVVI